MFINTSIFKKLIKEAYNAYMLMVGATEYEYFISNGAWIICVNKDDFTKKEKAAVIELTGELPDIGQAFKAGKDAPNQYEISKTVIRDIWGGDLQTVNVMCQ